MDRQPKIEPQREKRLTTESAEGTEAPKKTRDEASHQRLGATIFSEELLMVISAESA
jgi:hypothetical protein